MNLVLAQAEPSSRRRRISKSLRLEAGSGFAGTSFGVSLAADAHLALARLLLGGTGRMSTPTRSRVSGAAVDTSRRRVAGTRAGAVRPRRRAVVASSSGSTAAVFVMDRYEGLEPKFLQDFSEAERRAYVEANAAALRALLPADLVFTNHVLMGGPSERPAAPLSRQGTRLRARVLDARRPELGEWRGNSLRVRTRPTLAPSTSRSARRRGWPR